MPPTFDKKLIVSPDSATKHLEVIIGADIEENIVSALNVLNRYGIVIARSVFDVLKVDSIRESTIKYYSDVEKQLRNGNLSQPRSYLFNVQNMASAISALSDYSDSEFEIVDMLVNSPLMEVLSRRIVSPMLSVPHSRVRKVYATKPKTLADSFMKNIPTTTKWHCDGSEEVGYPGVHNIWIPLVDCTGKCSRVEFRVSDENGKEITCIPNAHKGDAFLFWEHIIHRTALSDDLTNDRYSAELRIFPYDAIRAHPGSKASQSPLIDLSSYRGEVMRS